MAMTESGQILVEKARKSGISSEVSTEAEVSAPVSKGCRLGTLTIRSDREILKQIPLVAGEDVPRLTFSELFIKVLRRAAMARE